MFLNLLLDFIDIRLITLEATWNKIDAHIYIKWRIRRLPYDER